MDNQNKKEKVNKNFNKISNINCTNKDSYTYQMQTNMSNGALETPKNHMHQQKKDITKGFTNSAENQNKKDENIKATLDRNINKK